MDYSLNVTYQLFFEDQKNYKMNIYLLYFTVCVCASFFFVFFLRGGGVTSR